MNKIKKINMLQQSNSDDVVTSRCSPLPNKSGTKLYAIGNGLDDLCRQKKPDTIGISGGKLTNKQYQNTGGKRLPTSTKLLYNKSSNKCVTRILDCNNDVELQKLKNNTNQSKVQPKKSNHRNKRNNSFRNNFSNNSANNTNGETKRRNQHYNNNNSSNIQNQNNPIGNKLFQNNNLIDNSYNNLKTSSSITNNNNNNKCDKNINKGQHPKKHNGLTKYLNIENSELEKRINAEITSKSIRQVKNNDSNVTQLGYSSSLSSVSSFLSSSTSCLTTSLVSSPTNLDNKSQVIESSTIVSSVNSLIISSSSSVSSSTSSLLSIASIPQPSTSASVSISQSSFESNSGYNNNESIINGTQIASIVSMGMSNLPTTTTTTVASSPASYSLDFLHYVGVQMTAGRSIVSSAATESLLNSTSNQLHHHTSHSPVHQPLHVQQQLSHQSNISATGHQNQVHQQKPNQIQVSPHRTSNTVSSSLNLNFHRNEYLTTGLLESQQGRHSNSNYIHLNGHCPPSKDFLFSGSNLHSVSNSSYSSNINGSGSNLNSTSVTSLSLNTPLSSTPGGYHNSQMTIQQVQQQQQSPHYQPNGHHHSNNFQIAHQSHQYHHNNNIRHSHFSSNNNFHNQNRNQYHKLKKGNLNNNGNNLNSNSTNKYGSLSSSNLNANLPAQRRNHQNHRNLTYVRATDSNRVINSSRSPTPSPKSESPSPMVKSSLQSGNTTSSLLNQNLLISSNGGMSLESNHLVATSMPAIDSQSASNNFVLSGYDSDSSHSSYRNDYGFRSTVSAQSSNYQLTELPSNSNLQNFNEDLYMRPPINYYGSHQNLSVWNTGFGTNYGQHSFTAADGTVHYAGVHEGNPNQHKRSYSGRNSSLNKNYRGGRRTLNHHYNNYRINNFNDNSAYMHTPPDRFLARAHLVQVKAPPENLLNGGKWDKLSQMVWDKFIGAQQSEETYKKKMYLWRYLYICIRKSYPRYGLFLVGSTISGFGSDTSDVDMCLVSRLMSNIDPRIEAVINLTELKNHLIASTGIFDQFHLIQAKVPILRFRDSMHLLEVDLNFNNCVGIRNTHLLQCYSQMDWRLRPLVLVVKLWAQFHHINNAKNKTISSYSLVLMVIHYLQCAVSPSVLPCLHTMYPEKFQKMHDINSIDMNEELPSFNSENKQTLGELFLGFLEYYSNFDYFQYAISIRTASLLPIEECRHAKSYKNDPHQWKQLCIEEPFDLTNTARSVYDGEIFERIKSVFVSSWKTLNESFDLDSIFTEPLTFLNPQTSSSTTTAISVTQTAATAET